MQRFEYSGNYDDPLLAELYDRFETYSDDINLIRRLIGNSGPLNILEPFCGTGRILVRLVQDGHRVAGIDMAQAMVARARSRVTAAGKEAEARVTLRVQDVLDGGWGEEYDLVIIGGNAFYELPASEMQERCIQLAYTALVPGGRLFVDNNDYKGDWSLGPFGQERVILEGTGSDGTLGRYTMTSLGFDGQEQVLEIKRVWETCTRDGVKRREEYLGHKHPVSGRDVEGWLKANGFRVLRLFGDRQGNPYTEQSDRAIFYAEKV